ncbi:beta-1,3-galactosyltransferase brn-like [Macrobrachium rosenbergii]|uniref:beta-1,3-galactosyltransferase brn-like n=1 Tax=Macrobrachium rosenbergii TaxID=79674 RepID=UPI0034D6B975
MPTNYSRYHPTNNSIHRIWVSICRSWQLFKMRGMSRRKCSFVSGCTVIALTLLYLSGLYQYALTWSYDYYYIHWGPSDPLDFLISQIKSGDAAKVPPVNEFQYSYTHSCKEKCEVNDNIRLMYVVKSALQNFEKRKSIRNSWGFENRFSDVEIRTVFLLGTLPGRPDLQEKVGKESSSHKDIIQAEFIDSYFNNTLKTMMGLHWTFHNCARVKYFFFVDDDYYVSTRNVLRFLRDPVNYPQYLEKYVVQAVNEYKEDLFAGYVFRSSRPIRWIYSKWYVTLDEYPYSHWPPYVTAGSYILSRRSLERLYFGSIYTSNFRFDDIFLGMAAKKADLKIFHHDEFYFYPRTYDRDGYKWVIASHGFDEPEKLIEVWNEQRSAGNS